MSAVSTTRACESCRALKVKCQPSLESATSACQKCAASGKECTYTERRRTKRKRTDVRVRELEREVAALSGLLQRQGSHDDVPSVQDERSSQDTSRITEPHRASVINNATTCSLPRQRSPSSSVFSPVFDPVSNGLVPYERAALLFQRYNSQLAPQRPMVVFPSDVNLEDVRSQKPTLFLSVLAAAAGTDDESLDKVLNERIIQAYADKVMFRGEKSLELVQAILVTTNWYHPPDKFEQLKFYQFLHIAATMAVDIGLSDPPPPAGISSTSELDPSSETLDRYRTMLACYLCCSSVSVKFHRQNMVLFTNHMGRCLDILESSENGLDTDPLLVAWVKLQRIIDLSDPALGLRDPTVRGDLSDLAVQKSLQTCSNQLDLWRLSLPSRILNSPLLIQYNALICLVHEIGLHGEYDANDFKPPYVIGRPRGETENSPSQDITPVRLGAIIKTINSSQSLCEIFLSMPTAHVRCSPVAIFARLGYAIVVLVKISVMLTLTTGSLRSVMNPEMARTDFYLQRVLQKLTGVCDLGSRVASKWFIVMKSVANWYAYFQEWATGQERIGDLELVEPLKHFDVEETWQGKAAASTQSSTGRSKPSQTPASSATPLPAPTLQWHPPIEEPYLGVSSSQINVLPETFHYTGAEVGASPLILDQFAGVGGEHMGWGWIPEVNMD